MLKKNYSETFPSEKIQDSSITTITQPTLARHSISNLYPLKTSEKSKGFLTFLGGLEIELKRIKEQNKIETNFEMPKLETKIFCIIEHTIST